MTDWLSRTFGDFDWLPGLTRAEELEAESVSAVESVINGPLTGEVGSTRFASPLEILANQERNNAIYLQNRSDDAANSGQYARISWLNRGDTGEDIEERAVVSYDVLDEHLSFYTDDPSSVDATKRLDIGAGSRTVRSQFRYHEVLQIDNGEGPTRLALTPAAGESSGLTFYGGANGDRLWDFKSRGIGDFVLQNFQSGKIFARVRDLNGGLINWKGTRMTGLREVGASPAAADLSSQEWAFTTDADGAGTPAWLYKDSTGTAHYMSTDGTL